MAGKKKNTKGDKKPGGKKGGDAGIETTSESIVTPKRGVVRKNRPRPKAPRPPPPQIMDLVHVLKTSSNKREVRTSITRLMKHGEDALDADVVEVAFAACMPLGDWRRCQSLVNDLRRAGRHPTTACLDSSLCACGRVGKPAEALAMLRGLAGETAAEGAMKMVERPSMLGWLGLLEACAHAGDVASAQDALALMEGDGLCTDPLVRGVLCAVKDARGQPMEVLNAGVEAEAEWKAVARCLESMRRQSGVLDLHGAGATAAGAAVLAVLRDLARAKEVKAGNGVAVASKYPGLLTADDDLFIVTGRGKNSPNGKSVVKESTLAVLRAAGIEPILTGEDEEWAPMSNPGMVHVPWDLLHGSSQAH